MKRLTRRIAALLAALALLPAAPARAADGALLPRVQTYDRRFRDVSAFDWLYPYVVANYEYGLMNGRDIGFAPYSDVTTEELLTLSARLRAAYAGDTITDDVPWSSAPYIAYLRQHGVYDDALTPTLTEKATRAQLAGIFAATLPEKCFDNRNDALVADAYASGSFITDVDENTPCREQILWLYRQGLLVGTDERGSYLPEQHAMRGKVAAIVARMADPALRLTPDWKIVPPWSAYGRTLASLVEAPPAAGGSSSSGSSAADDDAADVDARVRQMLSEGKRSIYLDYPTREDMPSPDTLMTAYLSCVKTYCEQMYNTVSYTPTGGTTARLDFSATFAAESLLALYRRQTMERAVEIHDELWASGKLNGNMSQYEIAKVYYRWLCEHCVYDRDGAKDNSSGSHLAYNALICGKAVCDGYTGAYNLFLKLEGIDCHGIYNDTHIWTTALLDGTLYHIDVTWGDQASYIDMSCFGMTKEQSYRLHAW